MALLSESPASVYVFLFRVVGTHSHPPTITYRKGISLFSGNSCEREDKEALLEKDVSRKIVSQVWTPNAGPSSQKVHPYNPGG